MFKKVCSGLLALSLFLSLTIQAADNPKVVMETSMGKVVLELYPEQAPITVKNFLAYVNDGFYDGTIFHRIIPNFMVQGGGYTKDFYEDQNKEKITRSAIKNESENGLSNTIGTIAMARTSIPDSATSQFFINVADNSRLDGRPGQAGYAVFGKVIEGSEVLKTISKVTTRKLGPTGDVPEEPVIINKIKVQ